ncbi:hypothetical protein [Stenotrophomonas terrae]|uniref:hypothetical protein n=1 Tax=Stenotrophomonas terrae TaxID=405446 RepID=UPI00128FC204|nr:hypothetical protein [Stenotrophomonas terrae]
MRELEPQRAVGANAGHREQLIFNVTRRLQRGVEMDRVVSMNHKNILSQMPRRDRRLAGAFHPVLNVGVKLPAIDVPDHPDSVVSNSLESVPRSSFRVNRTVCPKRAMRMKRPPKRPLPQSYLDRSSVALMRSCNSLSTSMPIAVSTGGVPAAYPHITRSPSNGGVSGLSPSATALNDDINALSAGRNSIHSFAKSPDLTIAGLRHGRNETKDLDRRTCITEPRNNRIKSARVAMEGEAHEHG